MREDENPIRKLYDHFPPACPPPPLFRPQKCRLLVEDRRVDPLFFYPFLPFFALFCPFSLFFFRLVSFACLTMPALTKSTSEKRFALVVIDKTHLSCSTTYLWIDLKGPCVFRILSTMMPFVYFHIKI